eukprot:TRINITY_DN22304_c0_g1_i1.p1 TRINITY_DN22304_c0_g1~~TRINITY_DN22304_c0_g1_i1.p1  ORF type:complete len:299 (-),score=39.25 TRINITY_DN22304_c0_g1_i1:80-976(-)
MRAYMKLGSVAMANSQAIVKSVSGLRTIGVSASPQARAGWLQRHGYRAFCQCSSSSSSEDRPFDMEALAQQLQVSRRKVKQAIMEAHEEGMDLYEEGDHIAKSDAQILALFWFGAELSRHNRQRVVEEVRHNRERVVEGQADEAGSDTGPKLEEFQLDCSRVHRRYSVYVSSGDQPAIDLDPIREIIDSGDVRKLARELKKPQYGLAMEELEGKNMVMAYNGARYPLHPKTKKWNQVVDGKSLMKFIEMNVMPGFARCSRCRTWFDTSAEEPIDYAAEQNCLGYCDTAKRVGASRASR